MSNGVSLDLPEAIAVDVHQTALQTNIIGDNNKVVDENGEELNKAIIDKEVHFDSMIGVGNNLSNDTCDYNDASQSVFQEIDRSKSYELVGERIVHLGFVLNEIIQKFNRENAHKSYCMNGNWQLFDEYRRDNKTKVYLQCDECNKIISVWSHPVSEIYLGVNESLVGGCMSSGIRYSTLQETLAATGVLVMSAKTFRWYHENMVLANIKISKECTARSSEEERKIAIKKSRIIMNLPYIIVIADGAWSKRTFGTAFDSLGGCAVVVGFETGEIINIVVRNTPCAICDIAERQSTGFPNRGDMILNVPIGLI